MKGLISMALATMVLVVGLLYVISSMGSLDAGTDVSGTAYDGAYAEQTEHTQNVLGFIGLIPYIVGAACMIGAIVFMKMTVFRHNL